MHPYLSAIRYFYKEHSLAHSRTSQFQVWVICSLYVFWYLTALSHFKPFNTLQCVDQPIYLPPSPSDCKPYENKDFILYPICASAKHNAEPLHLLNE